MKLTLEITDDQVAALRDELRIRHEDWKAIFKGDTPTPAMKYAGQIICARQALGMSNIDSSMCYDWYPEDSYAKT